MRRRIIVTFMAISLVGLIYAAGCDDDDDDFIIDPNGTVDETLMPLAQGNEWQGTIYFIGEDQDTTSTASAGMYIDTAKVVAGDTVYHLSIDHSIDSILLPEYLLHKDSALQGYIVEGVDLMLGPYTVAEYPTTVNSVFESYLGFETQVLSTSFPVEVPAGGFQTVYYRSIHPGFAGGQSDVSQIDRYFDPTYGLVRADVWGRDTLPTEQLLYIWSLDTVITDTNTVE